MKLKLVFFSLPLLLGQLQAQQMTGTIFFSGAIVQEPCALKIEKNIFLTNCLVGQHIVNTKTPLASSIVYDTETSIYKMANKKVTGTSNVMVVYIQYM